MSDEASTELTPQFAPSSLYWGGILIALIGTLLSIYATLHHIELKTLGATNAICNINETFSCDDIAASKYAEPFGIPMGIYGAGFFAGMLLLLGVALLKPEYRDDALHTYKWFTVLGVVKSIGLFIIAHFIIGKLCPTCIGVYLSCFAQAGLAWAKRSEFPVRSTFSDSFKSLSNGITYPVVTLLIAVVIYSFAKPSKPTHLDLKQPPIGDFDDSNPVVLEPNRQEIPISRSAYAGLGEDYRRGPEGAKITIVEFADYQCPACRHAYQALKDLEKEMPEIEMVFRNYPLDSACNPSISRRMHEFACEAATLARCAGRIGQFWNMHDRIYQNQTDLNSEALSKWGKEVGLTDQQIAECRTSQDISNKIRDDVKLGEKLGITGTPTIFVNGRKVDGAYNIEGLRKAVTAAQGR